MSNAARKLSWTWLPSELMARWPRQRGLAALCSGVGNGEANRWARWSVLAAPEAVEKIGPEEADPLARMFERVRSTARPGDGSKSVPFVGVWVVALSYELGRVVEPRSARKGDGGVRGVRGVRGVGGVRCAPEWPWSIVMWRCPAAVVYDHAERVWWSVGAHGRDEPRLEAEGFGADAPGFAIGEPEAETARSRYVRAVGRAVEYIRAGDVFEVNLAHRLRAACSGSARAMFLEMLEGGSPWYGAYLELVEDARARFVLSASPELFLEFDAATRRITTRPIKGTRAGDADPAALRASAKDQAELNMIVDLMRNDLGRVSAYGSVRVSEERAIERHGMPRGGFDGSGVLGVLHGVATVEGTLRPGADLSDLLHAAFPAGSITGAPKVRAMQLIEEMEASARGLYTGAIGYISDCGNMTLNVAIRTAVISGVRDAKAEGIDRIAAGTLGYGVGAGIVADSDPESEFAETMDKAGVLMRLAEGSRNHA